MCSPRQADARSVPRHARELSCHGIVNGFGTLGKGVSSFATEVAQDDFPAVRAQVALFPTPETPVLRAGADHVGPGTTFKARLGLPLVPAVAPLCSQEEGPGQMPHSALPLAQLDLALVLPGPDPKPVGHFHRHSQHVAVALEPGHDQQTFLKRRLTGSD